MSKPLTTKELIQEIGRKLDLRPITNSDANDSLNYMSMELVGLFNPTVLSPIAIISRPQLQNLNNLSQHYQNEIFSRLFSTESSLIILCDNLDPPALFVKLATENNKLLTISSQPATAVIDEINKVIHLLSLEHQHVHGVLLEVLGIGVLLTGSHNVGKSELALELISRGHSLVADDAPELIKISNSELEGKSPPTLYEFLEVRGLGIMNIRAMFGDNSIKDTKLLTLIIHLQETPYNDIDSDHRVHGNIEKHKLLGVEIDCITLPVAPGRNLAVLVETAVRNYLLRLKGYYSATEFVKRQRKQMELNQE